MERGELERFKMLGTMTSKPPIIAAAALVLPAPKDTTNGAIRSSFQDGLSQCGERRQKMTVSVFHQRSDGP